MKKVLFTLFAATMLTVSVNAQTQKTETKQEKTCCTKDADKKCTKDSKCTKDTKDAKCCTKDSKDAKTSTKTEAEKK